MTSSPKSFYARPSSNTRISTVLILYVLIGFTGFIFGFVAISGQSLGYKCRSGKSRLVSVVRDRSGGGIGNGAEVPDGDQKGTRLWVSLEFKLGLHQWYGGDPCGRLGCHLISKDFNDHEACLKEHTYQEVASNTCFFGESCQEVYSGLQARITIVNLLSDGLSWTLLRCIHGDQRGTFGLNGCCFEGRMQLKAGC